MLKNVIFMNKVEHFEILAWNDVFKNIDFTRLLGIMLNNVTFLTFLLLLDFGMHFGYNESKSK